MLLQTVIGNENWPSGQTKLHLFVCPTRQWNLIDGKEAHLWMLPRRQGDGVPVISQVGSPRIISAGLGLKPEIVGKWTTAVFDMPENVLLKAHLTRSAGGNNRQVSILMRTRNAAPLNQIVVSTIPNPKSAMDRLVIEGRFDIIDVPEAAQLGYQAPRMFLPTFQRSRWAQMNCLTIIEKAPETAQVARLIRKEVTSEGGETVTVVTAHRKRALDF